MSPRPDTLHPPRPRQRRSPKPRIPRRPSGKIDAATRNWAERVFDLRHATGWTRPQLGRLIRLVPGNIADIESRAESGESYYPSLDTIRNIRRVEDEYAWALREYREDPGRRDRLPFVVYRVVRSIKLDPTADRNSWSLMRVRVKKRRRRPVKYPAAPRRTDDLAPLAEGLAEQSIVVRPQRELSEKQIAAMESIGLRSFCRKQWRRVLLWAASGAFVEVLESRSERMDGEEVGVGFTDVEREREWGIDPGVE